MKSLYNCSCSHSFALQQSIRSKLGVTMVEKVQFANLKIDSPNVKLLKKLVDKGKQKAKYIAEV
jgi:hypothetical protein